MEITMEEFLEETKHLKPYSKYRGQFHDCYDHVIDNQLIRFTFMHASGKVERTNMLSEDNITRPTEH